MSNQIVRFLLLAILFSAFTLAQDGSAAPHSPVRQQFFAGMVTDLDSSRITVSRSVPGRQPEHHTFLIKPETKLGKNLRTKVRVTVRYVNSEEGDVALEILVRSQGKNLRTSSLFR